jgi:uncharacterized protein (UPF0335 family)
MTKRIKKSLVKPLMRRDWLRRFEEEGQSVADIAKTDHYDARTVRKQIEITRQERESREAHFFVQRQALEKHYTDLLFLAEKLDSGIIQSCVPMGIKSDRMWSALREHLPRSPLWKLTDKMERLNEEARDIEKRSQQHLWGEVGKESAFKVVSQPGVPEPGLYDNALIGAMNYHLHANPPCESPNIKTSSFNESLTSVNCAGFDCAIVHPEQVDKAKKIITDLMAKVCQWPEYEELRKTLSERTKVTEAIREELATIILKRVIPGHCKYCPV